MKKLAIALVAFACLYSTAADARRLPWCGIYMGKYFGMSDRSLWVARNWASVGTAASGPGEGVVVVWRHHVGVIVGRDSSGEWLVHSGNDGNAVRTRPRSLRGAIAFRHVGAGSSKSTSSAPFTEGVPSQRPLRMALWISSVVGASFNAGNSEAPSPNFRVLFSTFPSEW